MLDKLGPSEAAGDKGGLQEHGALSGRVAQVHRSIAR